jgi:PAS domain S-box-containing protein
MTDTRQPIDKESPLNHSSPTNGMVLPNMLDNLQAAVLMLDSGWQICYLNQSAALLLECNAAELIGKNFWSALPHFGESQFEQHFRQTLQEQPSAHFLEYYPPLQSYLAVQLYPAADSLLIFLQKDASKESATRKSPPSVELLVAEQSLEAVTQRTLAILESISDAFYSLDSEERFIYVNSKTEQLLYKSREELLGKCIWDVFPQMVGLQPYQHMRQALTEQIPVEFEIYSEYIKQWVDVSVYPTSDGISVYFRDVTERKLIERALQESEAKFSKIFQSSPVATLISTRGEGRILDVNNTTLQLLNYSREEMVGSTFAALNMWAEPETRKQLAEIIRKEGHVHGVEIPLKRKKGEIIYVLASMEFVELYGEPVMLSQLQDITALKNATQAQAQLASIVEFSEDAIIGKTLDGIIQSWNEGATKMYGYTAEEMLGKSINLLAVPHRHNEIPDLLAAIRHGEHIAHYETVRRCKDGAEIEISLTLSPLRDSSGNIIGASAISRVITERKQLEEALRQSEARFQAFMDNSPMLAWIADVEGEFRYVNKPFARMTGYEKERVIGKTVLELYPEEMAEQYRLDNLKVFETDKPLEVQERYIRGDGSKGYVLTNKFPLRDSSNPPLIGGVAIDITDRVQAEEALHLSEARFQAFMDNTPALSWMLDAEGVLQYVNKAFANMVGGEKEQIIGRTAFDLFPEEMAEQYRLDNLKVFETGHLLQVIEPYVRADGSTGYVMTNKFPLLGAYAPTLIGAVAIDITERVQAEEALQLSEERYRLLAQNSLDIISTNLPDGTIQYISPASRLILGYEPEELMGQSMYSLFHPDDLASVSELVNRVLDNKSKALALFRYRHKEGHYNWIESTSQVISDPHSGAVLYSMNVGREVTERVKAEEALRQSEGRYRLLARNLPNSAVMVFDRDLRYLVAEGGALAPNRFTNQVIEGKTIHEVLPPEAVARLLPHYQAALAGIESTFEDYYNEQVFLVRAVPVKDEQGKIINGMILSQDITELKHVEHSLADEKERLSVTLRSIGDAVITTDLEGRITLINRIAEELTGWKHTDAIGQLLDTVLLLLDEETRQRRESPLRETLNTGHVILLQNNTLMVARDGVERIIMDSCAPIRDRQSNIIGVVLVFRDVTSQLRLEHEVQKAAKLESLGVFAGGLAHDFNNLLAGITGYLDLSKYYLENSESQQNVELKDFIAQAQAATLRARELTIQLLTFAKGGRPIKKTVALPQIIEEATRFILHGTNVKAVFELPEDLFPIEADVGQLGQVVHNLVLNAIQAMPQGGIITVSARNVRIDEDALLGLKAGSYVQISFRDEGSGINSENLSKIFDPYFTTKKSGNGLGLSVCHSIIRQHSGHIEVESVVGTGTTFTIYLPASIQQPETTGSFVKPVMSYTRSTTPMRILIMDDEELLRNMARRLLLRLGHTVGVAEDGEEAYRLYGAALEAGQPFDVVLLDLTIPGGMGGKQTMVKLLELDPHVTAVVCSGYSNDPIMSDYQLYGFKEVLPKPYHMEDLQKLLDKLAGETHPTDSDKAN